MPLLLPARSAAGNGGQGDEHGQEETNAGPSIHSDLLFASSDIQPQGRDAVIVQPSVYGTNNSVTLDAIAQYGDDCRGIAVIEPDCCASTEVLNNEAEIAMSISIPIAFHCLVKGTAFLN